MISRSISPVFLPPVAPFFLLSPSPTKLLQTALGDAARRPLFSCSVAPPSLSHALFLCRAIVVYLQKQKLCSPYPPSLGSLASLLCAVQNSGSQLLLGRKNDLSFSALTEESRALPPLDRKLSTVL